MRYNFSADPAELMEQYGLSPQIMDLLISHFSFFDMNDDGVISLQELETMYNQVSRTYANPAHPLSPVFNSPNPPPPPLPTEMDITALFYEADTNQSGFIEFEDFTRVRVD
ncbi:hypothetical protein H696_00111 [Fonticula alba]|uniref:EF-hand domain-containing protein n=1 Tax=Fonticula alba TaxID=691883 RepID=A0A058ZGB4_FONAL|nr:hypothetical protein H696_00111 [Fonticula alba]KCV72517.1 hypothetical protein H696_00111 [Fonticula alba]|eukprot:XP_009492218.1 hypothetical protein H696_00111 [Fonticula alba]